MFSLRTANPSTEKTVWKQTNMVLTKLEHVLRGMLLLINLAVMSTADLQCPGWFSIVHQWESRKQEYGNRTTQLPTRLCSIHTENYHESVYKAIHRFVRSCHVMRRRHPVKIICIIYCLLKVLGVVAQVPEGLVMNAYTGAQGLLLKQKKDTYPKTAQGVIVLWYSITSPHKALYFFPFVFHSARFPPPQRSVLDIKKPSSSRRQYEFSLLLFFFFFLSKSLLYPITTTPLKLPDTFTIIPHVFFLSAVMFLLSLDISLCIVNDTCGITRIRGTVTFKHQRDKDILCSAICCLVMAMQSWHNFLQFTSLTTKPSAVFFLPESSVYGILMKALLI